MSLVCGFRVEQEKACPDMPCACGQGRGSVPSGDTVPFTVGRHRHPKTRTRDGERRAGPAPTGIDYLAALGDAHDAGLKDQVSYRSLAGGPQEREEKEEGRDHE